MKGLTLQKTALLSAALHLSFIILAAFIFRNTQQMVMPSPYEVTLVGPMTQVRGRSAGEAVEQKQTDNAKESHTAVKDKRIEDSKKEDLKHLEDRLAELRSKKRVERIVELRKKLNAISGQPEIVQKKVPGVVSGTTHTGSGPYEDLVASLIERELVFPDKDDAQLATHILVQILGNGELKIMNIEKMSGNALFDRAALRAIERANPVPPPPKEMDVVFRLHPYGVRR